MIILASTCLLLAGSASALPIPSRESIPTVAVSCAILAALLLFLMTLIFLKHVFVRQRRALIWEARQNSALSLSAGSTSVDSASSIQSEKKAFVVGFLGSPNVEIQCALEKAELAQPRYFPSDPRKSVSHSKYPKHPSVLEITRRFERSVSTPSRGDSESLTIRMPSTPDQAHVNSSLPNRRRFSLPNMHRSHTAQSHRPRHSSLKTNSRRSSVNCSAPASPRTNHSSQSQSQEIHTPTSNPQTSPKILAHSFIPPLPPLPLGIHSTPRKGTIQISHPYALSRRSKKHAAPSEPSSKLGTRRRSVRSTASGALSPTLNAFPSPPPNVAASLNARVRPRSHRTSAIVPVGPSPLRTMILPDSTDGHLAAALSSFLASSGSPSAVTDTLGAGDQTRRGNVPSRATPKPDDDDPESLLGMIRELVEETSAWDTGTVFMSQNFKNLLAQPSAPDGRDLNAENSVQPSEPAFIESDSSRSTELDLASLGIEMINAESFYSGFLQENVDVSTVGVAW